MGNNMKKLSLFLAVVLMFGAANAFAQNKLDEIFKAMAASDAKVNTLEAVYDQIVDFEITGERQVITGNLKYLKPSSIYVVQKTPQEQRIYIDGKNITIYTPENQQAVIDSWSNAFNVGFAPTSLINMGANHKQIAKNNDIKYLRETEDFYIIEISPKAVKDWVMTVHISKEDLRVKNAIVRSQGTSVTVDIKEYKINQNFDKSMFSFKAPQGVEVIKLN